MKILKYSFVILVVSMVANIAMVSATVTLRPDQWGVSGQSEIPAGKTIKTVEVVKERFATQNFYNYYANTPQTIPCTDCKFNVELYKKVSNNNWNKVGTVKNIQMKQRGYFYNNTSEGPGTYYLSIKRNGFTVYTTILIWEWFVQDKIQ